jgi:hypothetical protein
MRSIAFACQVILGTLVNAILNDPGPLSIKEMEVRLSGCLLLLLEAEAGAKPKASKNAELRRR